MIECKGNILKETSSVENDIVLVTCNSIIKSNGELVMGAGWAKECAEYNPHLPRLFAEAIAKVAINIHDCLTYFLVFPNPYGGLAGNFAAFQTKFHFKDPSPSWLVAHSVNQLHIVARTHPYNNYHLPRPGCGNGGLSWDNEVKEICKDLPDNVYIWSKE